MTPTRSTSKNRATKPVSRIRHLRAHARGGPHNKDKAWTRIQLAVYANVALGTIDKLEAAEADEDLTTLERAQVATYRKIATALGVRVGQLCPWLAS